MSGVLFVGVVVLAAIIVGQLAFRRFGTASDTVFAVWRSVFAVTWILSGIALIVGGYVVFGAAMIALFWFVLIGGLSDLSEELGGSGSWRRRFSR